MPRGAADKRRGRAAAIALVPLLAAASAVVFRRSTAVFVTQPLSRRATVLSLPAALGALASTPDQALAASYQTPLNAQKVNAAEVVRDANQVLEGIKSRWESLMSKSDTAAAEEVLSAFQPFIAFQLTVSVDAGKPLDVDIEGLKISDVRSKSLGWKKGDRIISVNSQEVLNFDDVRDQVKASKDKSEPVVVVVERRTESPFARLLKALQGVYEDTSNPLSEPDDVLSKVGSLKNKATFCVDGIVEAKSVKKKLDDVSKDLQAYVNAMDADTQKQAAASSSGSSSSGDLDGLFR